MSVILKYNDVRFVQVNKEAKAVCCFEKDIQLIL